jgi:hypothetical protein
MPANKGVLRLFSNALISGSTEIQRFNREKSFDTQMLM